MSDNAANQESASSGPSTIAEILEGAGPMGDLSRFAIDDLTAEEEDEFFGILESL